MDFSFLLKCMNVLSMIWLSSYLQSVESIPVSNSTVFINDVTDNSSALSEYFGFNKGKEVKNIGLSNVSNNKLDEKTNEATVIAETSTNKERVWKSLLSPLVMPYLCDIEKGICWLNQNQKNLVTFLIPIELLPYKQPPAEIGLKEFYSLVSKKKKQQMDKFGFLSDPTNLNSVMEGQDFSFDAHPRRKRDTQYAEENGYPQQEWANEGEYESNQPLRVQRNIPSTSTEQSSSSTEDPTKRNVDPQANKQSKRSAETDGDDADDTDVASPSPDEDYEDDNENDYHPEKRFAGPETTEVPQKFGDSPTKNPTQPIRRAAVNPNYNYPFLANPDYYYPSQRMLSPFDGISYRSAEALPMMYMNPDAVFWQTKFVRSPQSWYQQRQSPGYGGGWPPMRSYYQPYANRYPQTYPTPPAQQNSVHYHRQHPQNQSYRPNSYSYPKANKNYKAPARKPIETDANMYYGK